MTISHRFFCIRTQLHQHGNEYLIKSNLILDIYFAYLLVILSMAKLDTHRYVINIAGMKILFMGNTQQEKEFSEENHTKLLQRELNSNNQL